MKAKNPGKSVFLFLLLLCLLGAQEVKAVQTVKPQIVLVRGKIERQGKPNYPAAYVRLQLSPSSDQKRIFLAYTGPDGLYYFRVAPGNYVLNVKISETRSKSYLIQVNGQKKTVDVGLIVIS